MFKTRVGDTLYVYDEASRGKVEKIIFAHMLKTGEARQDGEITQYIEDIEVLDTDYRNIWDASGNKAKHNRYLVTINNGVKTVKILKTIWKSL